MARKDSWIKPLRGAADARARVLFFPHAGGAASFYAPFAQRFPEGYDVAAVQYPGRQERWGEPFVTTVEGLADRLVPSLRRWAAKPVPLVLVGHSMGASVAFESMLRLGHDRLTAHCRLVVSGRAAPSVTQEAQTFDSDQDLLDHLARLGGTDAAILSSPDLMDLVLPAVRNDYRAVTSYRPAPDAVVETPVLCLTGDRDPQVTAEEAGAWKRHTTAGFRLKMLPGGHFFLSDHPDTVVRLVAECAEFGDR
ncbi:alpha/beta fold hydrolase [Streptomyces sp. NPDC052687]|uniref:thioesterase II family protein n=1 Tax=Streptomyces sp. NPDC052687 TaxID=3154759 RepID=UPI00341DCF43